MRKPKVVITPRSFPWSIEGICEPLKKQGYHLIKNPYGRVLTEDEMCELCRDVDGIIAGGDPITGRVLHEAKYLKGISKYGSGLDTIDMDAACKLGIAVKGGAGANAVSVAELAIALLICAYRGICSSALSTKSDGWKETRGREVMGSTVGIVGCGNIGREFAKRVSAFGANVLIYHRRPVQQQVLDMCGARQVSFDTLLAESDAVSLHCPLTPQTVRLMGRDAIARMKNGAVLINTARGELVDEDALYDALTVGKLRAAAQDVFSCEPPEPGHKLLLLDNFMLTAHIGASTDEAVIRMATRAVENMVELLGCQTEQCVT